VRPETLSEKGEEKVNLTIGLRALPGDLSPSRGEGGGRGGERQNSNASQRSGGKKKKAEER